MNRIERTKVVMAMELLARCVNDEEVFDGWLYNGVADGDIQYGDMELSEENLENLEWYTEDDNFKDLMGVFLRLMNKARRSGGLYCDEVVSAD